MKSRKHYKPHKYEDMKIPVCVSISPRELRKIDRVSRRKGFKNRSHYILSLVLKDVKRHI